MEVGLLQTSNGLASLIGLLVLAGLVFLNLDGYQFEPCGYFGSPVGLLGPNNFTGEPPTSNWVHGWPVGCAIRLCIEPPSHAIQSTRQLITTSRWPLYGPSPSFFSALALGIDIAIGAIVAAGAYLGSNRIFSRLGWRLKYGIRSLMVLTTLVGITIASWRWLFADRNPAQAIATTFVAVGVIAGLYWLAAIVFARYARSAAVS